MDYVGKLLGSRINIQRSDGRVHQALVSAVSPEKKSVKVEWFENGETKGKETDWNAIMALNPDVFIQNTVEDEAEELPVNESSLSATNVQRVDNRLHRSSSKSAIPINKSRISHLRSVRLDESLRESIMRNNINKHTGDVISDGNLRSMRRFTGTQPSKCLKKSTVVREVEKLKRIREERRVKQAEERAEKDAFLQQAPGNPHWELLHMIENFRKNLEIRPLTESDPVEDHLITVCVRKRPMNRKEINRKEVDVITVPFKNQIIVHEPKMKVDLTKYLENQAFRFDYALDDTASNEMVYKYTAQPLVKTIFEGGFATCFAYGQTGSGKTHTMGGDFNGKSQDCTKGIYALAVTDVFRLSKLPKYNDLNLSVSVSFFEIYSGKVFDLLNHKTKLRILEDGRQIVQVVGLTEKLVISTADVLKLLQQGNTARTSGTTAVNSNSSRSHAVFQIILRNPMGRIHGKFSLIDLAGNERGADTCSSNRQTSNVLPTKLNFLEVYINYIPIGMEGAEINKSLLALKECIRALSKKSAHLPFRVSTLTQVLRDSFVGSKSRTCMIAMISPGVTSCENSLNTLRYADRVKELGVVETSTKQETDSIREVEVEVESITENFSNMEKELLQLKTLNETDMPLEMYEFQQVISELQTAEDEMVEGHKHLIDYLKDTVEKAENLVSTTNHVEYDQEVYCQAWYDILRETIGKLIESKMIVGDFREKMVAEEQLSRKTAKLQ